MIGVVPSDGELVDELTIDVLLSFFSVAYVSAVDVFGLRCITGSITFKILTCLE
jgi:hypothetical protein